MFDICVFAGRMRPPTSAHLANIRAGLAHAQYTFVVIGSIDEATHFKNPFTFQEVTAMLRGSLTPVENDRVFIFGVPDRDSDLAWVRDVQRVTADQAKRLSFDHEPRIALVGCKKDESGYYLGLFPQWDSVAVEPIAIGGDTSLSSTFIRNQLYSTEDAPRLLEFYREQFGESMIPRGTFLFLRQWVHTDHFKRMRAAAVQMKGYLEEFQRNPYTNDPQQFLTADMCPIQAGAVLLVKRKKDPGKGLWALPGGHKRAYQTFRDAALDELQQETGISDLNPDMTREFLNLCIRGEKLLDNPWRSNREVTVSYAYGLLLPGNKRPVVEGRDDAEDARWWNIDEVTRGMMFEDHFQVIEDFAGRFRGLTL